MKTTEKDVALCAGFGILEAGSALYELLGYASNKAAVIQAQLNKAPEITAQVYQAAEKFARDIVPTTDFYLGLAALVASAAFSGVAVRLAVRSGKDSSADVRK